MAHYDVQTTQCSAIFTAVEQEARKGSSETQGLLASLEQVAALAIHESLRGSLAAVSAEAFEPISAEIIQRLETASAAGFQVVGIIRDGDSVMADSASRGSAEAGSVRSFSRRYE